MPTLFGRNYQLKELELLWGPLYEQVLSLLGSTGTILPIGDPKHGQPNATTFKTVGEEQVTFTWSEAPASFDTGLDLTGKASFQGIIPVVKLNGSDEEVDSPDADYWSRDDSSGESMSMGLWVNFVSIVGIQTLLAKDDAGTHREWEFGNKANGVLELTTIDRSVPVFPRRTADAAYLAGVWLFLVATYDGRGGAANADGITLYKDGTVWASTAANQGAYVAMENLDAVVTLAKLGDNTQYVGGKMAGGPLGPFFTQTELSADAILRLYNLGRRALGL